MLYSCEQVTVKIVELHPEQSGPGSGVSGVNRTLVFCASTQQSQDQVEFCYLPYYPAYAGNFM